MNKRAQQLLATAVHENGFLIFSIRIVATSSSILVFLFSETDAQENVSFANFSRSPPHWLHTQINAQGTVFYQLETRESLYLQ